MFSDPTTRSHRAVWSRDFFFWPYCKLSIPPRVLQVDVIQHSRSASTDPSGSSLPVDHPQLDRWQSLPNIAGRVLSRAPWPCIPRIRKKMRNYWPTSRRSLSAFCRSFSLALSLFYSPSLSLSLPVHPSCAFSSFLLICSLTLARLASFRLMPACRLPAREPLAQTAGFLAVR